MTGPSDSNLNRGEADPFSHLHKMSTTAGLGSGDYVAINGTAIAAILLGVGSSLVLFNSLVFLVIPLVGVVAAILAFKQISASNGTQTGREVAVIGLLLSLGFGGFYGAKTLYTVIHARSDQEQVIATVHKLGELLKTNAYTDAYALCDERFRKRVPLADFQAGWQRITSSAYIGNVQSIDWNQVLSLDVDPVDGSKLANGQMLVQAKPVEKLRINMGFRNDGSGWLIDQIPQMFPDAPPAPPEKKSTFIGPPKPAQ
jgi:positive regulator of sigma E activity